MLAIITTQLLIRVEDEEEAGRLAILSEKAAALQMERLYEISGVEGDKREMYDGNISLLGTQVTILPDQVIEGSLPY